MSYQSTKSTITPSNDPQTNPNKSQKKRGKINIVACDRCKRDKKRCDGYYLTQKACKYCRNHNEDCVYSEPNLLRISRILNAAAKNAAAAQDDPESSIQELRKQIVKHENTIINLLDQLENKNEIEQPNTITDIIGKLYISLFSDPQISNEQTIILKRLCEITNNLNPNIDYDNIRNKLLILVSNDRTEIEKRQIWNELDKFVKIYNNNDNDIIITSDNFLNSNIFGFSYPSGSTTPIPSPQQDTSNHETISRKRNSKKFEKNYEPYPSGGRISIRPSRKESNVMIWHQNDPCDDVPIIAFHGSQNNQDRSIDSSEPFQNSNLQFDNLNDNLHFPASNLLLSPNEAYGFDEAGQFFSNATSPTFSNNSTSDDNFDNFEYPTFMPHPLVENLLEFFPNSL